MPHATALCRILVARRFAWPNQLMGFLLIETSEWLFCIMSSVAVVRRRHHKVSGSQISRTV